MARYGRGGASAAFLIFGQLVLGEREFAHAGRDRDRPDAASASRSAPIRTIAGAGNILKASITS